MSETWRARFPRRTVHLDFHTGPDIPGVGAGFDPDAFARTFADAHVDSVTVFAKCHHGQLYYATDRPERHPSLPPGLDLLGEQVQALHAARIRAPIYLSVQCDEFAANHHPEWLALTAAGTQVRMRSAGALEAAWQVLDLSSPYQEYLVEQLGEVLERFAPVDGIFLDMCWDQPSCSRWALEGMAREGLEATDPADRARYARLVAERFMARCSQLVEPALVPGSATGTWFNSRPKAEIAAHRGHLRHVEVEALPTGGWGYSYLPYVGRLVRSLGLPALSHTGRFHRSWGDAASLKHGAALKYECCRILLEGLSNGVGDLLPPSGVPSAAVYEQIGSVFTHVAACEPYLEGGRHLAEVALLTDPASGDAPPDGVLGALRALQQLRQQFDVLPLDADLSAYRLVVVPEGTEVGAGLAARLRAHVEGGGALLLAAEAAAGSPAAGWLAGIGLEVGEPLAFDPVFLGLRAPGLLDPAPGLDVRVPGGGREVAASGGAEVLVELVLPFFQRSYRQFSGHDYTPPAGPSGRGAVLQSGSVVLLAVPLLAAVATEGNAEYLQVLGACLRRLLPNPLLEAGGPLHLETAVVSSPERTAVHLLSYLPSRAARELDLVVDPFPLVDLELALRCEIPPVRASLQPAGAPLALTHEGGYARVRASVLDGHALVVFEHERGAGPGPLAGPGSLAGPGPLAGAGEELPADRGRKVVP